jgi:hypothetical protein
MKSLDTGHSADKADAAVKKRRGRRPKAAVTSDKADVGPVLPDGGTAPARITNGAVGSVSELAQRLAEDHISPITRERLTFAGALQRRGSVDTARFV